MDNIKTGALIKELRKEKNMTQKELAERLHITDRAVSKWERGLCAPDISLLEPLSEILDLSIAELIEGNRVVHDVYIVEIEESAKSILGYSKEEIKRKIKTIRAKYLIITAACLAATIVIFSFFYGEVVIFSSLIKVHLRME